MAAGDKDTARRPHGVEGHTFVARRTPFETTVKPSDTARFLDAGDRSVAGSKTVRQPVSPS
jgi:hypothetical protein